MADPEDGQGDGPSADGSSTDLASDGGDGSENSTAVARIAESEGDGGPAGTGSTSALYQASACRVVGTHIIDSNMPVSGWVDVDPDGCLQRILYRALTIPPANAYAQVRSRIPF